MEEYLDLIETEKADVAREEQLGLPPLTVPGSFIRIASALYSAGETPSASRRALAQAVDYRLKFFEVSGYRLRGYGTLPMDLEVFGGAAIIGRVEELVQAFRRCEFDAPPQPPIAALMKQFCAMWMGEDTTLKPGEAAALKKLAKDWVLLPPAFEAVARKNEDAFGMALAEHLTKAWAKTVRALAREENYDGRWSMLAGGLCQRIGRVPEMPPAAAQYVPDEILDL